MIPISGNGTWLLVLLCVMMCLPSTFDHVEIIFSFSSCIAGYTSGFLFRRTGGHEWDFLHYNNGAYMSSCATYCHYKEKREYLWNLVVTISFILLPLILILSYLNITTWFRYHYIILPLTFTSVVGNIHIAC